MNQYTIRCTVHHVLVVEAETEAEARQQAQHTDFNDWNHYPSGFDIKELTSPPATIPGRVRQALRTVLDYL